MHVLRSFPRSFPRALLRVAPLALAAFVALPPTALAETLAERVVGWEPEGEGYSMHDGVMVALTGRWRSLDDPTSEIAIDAWAPSGPVHAFIRDGTVETPERVGFGGSCEGPMADDELGYLAVGEDDPLCYSIERLTDDYLQMSFYGAGLSVHRFERVAHDPGLPGDAVLTADEGSCEALGDTRSTAWDVPVAVRFTNATQRDLTVSWIDYSGARRTYATLEPGETFDQETFETHPWEFSDADGCVEIVMPNAGTSAHDVRG